jgi:hypothetical protein
MNAIAAAAGVNKTPNAAAAAPCSANLPTLTPTVGWRRVPPSVMGERNRSRRTSFGSAAAAVKFESALQGALKRRLCFGVRLELAQVDTIDSHIDV